MSVTLKANTKDNTITIELNDASPINSHYEAELPTVASGFKYQGATVTKVVVYSTRFVNRNDLLSDSLEYRSHIGPSSGLAFIPDTKLDVSERVNCMFSTTDGIFMITPKGVISEIKECVTYGIRKK